MSDIYQLLSTMHSENTRAMETWVNQSNNEQSLIRYYMDYGSGRIFNSGKTLFSLLQYRKQLAGVDQNEKLELPAPILGSHYDMVDTLASLGFYMGLDAMHRNYSKRLVGLVLNNCIINDNNPHLAVHVDLYNKPEGVWKHIKLNMKHDLFANSEGYHLRRQWYADMVEESAIQRHAVQFVDECGYDYWAENTIVIPSYLMSSSSPHPIEMFKKEAHDSLQEQFDNGSLGMGKEVIPTELAKEKRGY